MTGFEPQTFTTIAQEKPVIHHRAQGDERGGGKAQVLSIIFSSMVATTFLSALGKVEDEIFRYYLSEVESLMSN